MPKKYDAVFQQRDNRNTKFREVVISGSNLIVQTDFNGNLVGKPLGNTFSSASNFDVTNTLTTTDLIVRNSLTASTILTDRLTTLELLVRNSLTASTILTNNIYATGSITASRFLATGNDGQAQFIGTSSWALYAVNGGTLLQTGSRYPITSSWALRAITASYVDSAQFVFTDDLTVSLSSGKTFGKYTNGQTIPAAGKTPAQVIELAIVEPLSPTVTLTSPTTIAFNQTAISNELSGAYTINSLGGSVSTVSLEWRRGGAGAWTVLSTSTTTPLTFTHNTTNDAFDTSAFNYRYVVTDSKGAENTATVNITPGGYSAPSISLSVVGNSLTSPETNTKREKGNVSTTLSGTITRNTSNVALSSYTVQYSVNGGGWSSVPGLDGISISGASANIPATVHNPTGDNTASSIAYRVQVVDAYQTTTSSTTTISFLYLIFYGPVASAPTDSAGVRALGTRIFTDGSNPYNLITGTTERIFTSAMPATSTITQILDLDALNSNITNFYILSTFNVNDFAGNAVSYNVYTDTMAVPYTDMSHRHQTTRS